MFTGLVDHVGVVESIDSHPESKTLTIQTQFKDLKAGESISVNGVCLTVTKLGKGFFQTDISSETLRLTNLKEIQKNASINLERALLMGDRMGGHFVTGHVDSTLLVERVQTSSDYLEVAFGAVEPKFRKFIHSKGCISLNGVSLTINDVQPQKSGFNVMLIPHTLERTNLKHIRTGMRVNVEFDWMAKIILERLEEYMPQVNSLELSPVFEKSRSLEDI